jgi:uncharacterized membrane protein YeaQ/YmgE (transglycosylase-associated protein family)
VLILAILVFGMAVGWLAQLVLGMGTRPNGQSLVAGLVGSLVGGTLGSLLGDEGFRIRPAGLIGAFVGALLVLLAWGAFARRRRAI